MTDHPRRLRPAGPRQRSSPAVASPIIILAAVLSGCVSSQSPRPALRPDRRPVPIASTESSGDLSGEAPVVDEAVSPATAETSPAPVPAPVPTGFAPAVPPAAQEYPIDLTSALRLAEVENPTIAEARQRILEAIAVRQRAQSLLLPSLNAGGNYRSHVGNLQRTSGQILDVELRSLYLGGGAGAIGSNPVAIPTVLVASPLTDAIFEPLAARQQVAEARFNAAATANAVLLEVAELHLELVAAEAQLEARRMSASEGAEIARLTRAYAEAGQGRSADASRALTELLLIGRETQQAEENVAVASVRLARRLHLDQTVRLRPTSPAVAPIVLIDPGVPLPEQIGDALRRRPEVGARASGIAAAEARLRREQYRPLLPTLWLGFTGGAFGGDSDLVAQSVWDLDGRTDFDVRAFWTVLNLGHGNRTLQRRQKALVGVAVGEQARAIAAIRAEVAAAYAQSAAARRQIVATQDQLRSAEDGFRQDLDRIRSTVGRPIEAVDSLRLLNDARQAAIRSVTEYNKAQFRLYVALGSPPPLDRPASDPLPAAPVAFPPLGRPRAAHATEGGRDEHSHHLEAVAPG